MSAFEYQIQKQITTADLRLEWIGWIVVEDVETEEARRTYDSLRFLDGERYRLARRTLGPWESLA